jgi:hypothetical protein
VQGLTGRAAFGLRLVSAEGERVALATGSGEGEGSSSVNSSGAQASSRCQVR